MLFCLVSLEISCTALLWCWCSSSEWCGRKMNLWHLQCSTCIIRQGALEAFLRYLTETSGLWNRDIRTVARKSLLGRRLQSRRQLGQRKERRSLLSRQMYPGSLWSKQSLSTLVNKSWIFQWRLKKTELSHLHLAIHPYSSFIPRELYERRHYHVQYSTSSLGNFFLACMTFRTLM